MNAQILNAEKLSPMQARYWNACARKKQVNIVDPFRTNLRELRKLFPSKTVYRASTGGKYGKSSEIVTL